MRITIQSPNVKVSKHVERLIHEKVEKLGLYSDRIMEANVLLKEERTTTGVDKVCEIKLGIPGNDLFAKKQAASFPEALAAVTEALTNQVKSWQERRLAH